MRKLVIAALFVLALVCFAGASVAYAGDCCKPKCEQKTCTKACKSKCSPCETKSDPCKPVCKPKCDPCKPACEPKCEQKCKPKCKQNTCTKPCKPKCDPCKPKCDPCKPKCKPKCDPCKPVCKPKCEQNTCTKPCKPKCDPCKPVCKPKCEQKCDPCAKPKCADQCTTDKYKHPYEACWHGDGMLCDTGCCGTYLPRKNECMTCETVCKCVETCDPCNPCKTKVKYEYETVCHEITRPRTIPWWFNEAGPGNIYLEDEPAVAAEE